MLFRLKSASNRKPPIVIVTMLSLRKPTQRYQAFFPTLGGDLTHCFFAAQRGPGQMLGRDSHGGTSKRIPGNALGRQAPRYIYCCCSNSTILSNSYWDLATDMTSFYFLLSRVPNGLTNSSNTFEELISAQGLVIVKEQQAQKTPHAATKSANSFVQRVLPSIKANGENSNSNSTS